MLRVLLVVCLLAAFSGSEAVTLTATVSSGGVKGTVTFTQANPGAAVTLAFTLEGPNSASVQNWQLHTHRLNYDVADRCSEQNLGVRFLLNVGGSATNGDVSGFDLSGINSIEGRSIALLDSSSAVVACATVESAQEYATATAVFRSKVLGHVTFRQVKTLPAALTQVASDLYFDGSETTATDLEWRVVEAGSSDCTTVGAAYDPSSSASGACSTTQHSSCAIGDLSGKLGNVGVGVVRGSRRKTAADLHLPVTGTNQISGHILLLSSGTDTVACATIRLHQARSGVATFDNDGVTGTVTLTQPSPLDPATAVVKLSNLRSLAGGYHVHEWPVPQRAVASQQLCSGGSVAGHFNPFGIIYDSDSPAAATSTEDMYEVGDLSRKYGMLNGLTELDKTYTDWNLQLFGPNSVLGRSLVIHNDTAGTPRWICTNIHDTAALTVAMATFTYPVIGYVMFQQRQGEEFAETTIYTRLDYGDGSVTATSGHAWGIHASPVSSDMVSSDVNTRCVSGGDRISPYGVSGTNYATQCTSSAQLRCGLGDLGGKHGKLSVRSASGAPAISFGTDVNLPLTGDNSIVGKSVVLMSASGGNSRLACASVIRVTPRHAKVDSWGSTSYGSVSFTQASGVIQQPTTISFNLQSLPETTSGNAYRIHDGSVSSSSSASDRCGNVGSVYDPFSVTPASGGVVTKDKVPVGDLAAKFGLLMQADVSKTVQDPSLDLFGLRSVVGRAMTLSSSENVFACGDVMGAVQEGGMLVEAEAVFSGDVIGKVMMSQYLYPDGSMSDTTVTVNLRKASDPQTQLHNWHTHEYHVGTDTADKPCASTGGHFNPFVNFTANYDECGPENPLRCEVGDQSKKLGTYNMGSGQMLATDVYLPLTGEYGVIGRSIVVHAENRGAPRIACADIMPSKLTNTFHVRISMAAAQFDSLSMREKVADAVGAEMYDVVVETTGPDRGCTGVRIYFMGLEGDRYRQKFIDMLHSERMSTMMGDYTPVTCSGSISMTSLVLLLTSWVLVRFLS